MRLEHRCRLSDKGRPTTQQLKEHDPKPIQVRARVDVSRVPALLG